MKRILAAFLTALAVVGCSKEETRETGKSEMSAAVREAIDRISQLEGAGCHVSARHLDVSGMTAGEFRRELDAYRGKDVHLWMPGEHDWLLVCRAETNKTSLAAAMEFFAADTNCTMSVPEIFASYVGTRDDVIPAFRSVLEGTVVPEWFVTADVPNVDWLDASGIDEDIAKTTLAEIRSVQVVRRTVLRGRMLAAKAVDKKGEEEATDMWARAALRNPHDPMLLERIEVLNRNARGFLEVGKVVQAMKCYETLVLIRPDDPVAIHNFGMCLKKIGKLDMAEKVLERARKLSEAPLDSNN